MEPDIVMFEGKQLAGVHTTMSFSHNTTPELWRSFMPRLRALIPGRQTDLYSVQFYGESFFERFNPATTFEKWAAVELTKDEKMPGWMETIIIPPGRYAVFTHRGAGPAAYDTFSYIFNVWLPGSGFILDSRPHFEVMGVKYKNDDPDSEEEVWIPVRKK